MLHPKTCNSSIKHCVLLPLPDDNPPPVFAAGAPDLSNKPIWVARKVKRKKQFNVTLDDRRYPDQSHGFDVILHNVKGSPILRGRKHPAPPIDNIDPHFLSCHDKACHGAKL